MAIRKFINILSTINLITFSRHFLKKILNWGFFIRKIAKIYYILDIVGIVSTYSVLIFVNFN